MVGVGVGGLFGAMGHLFAADKVAEQLGWATGSPFQTEVGLFDLAFGVLGVCCIWFRGQWWYAVTLGWTIFAVGAGVNHLYEMSGLREQRVAERRFRAARPDRAGAARGRCSIVRRRLGGGGAQPGARGARRSLSLRSRGRAEAAGAREAASVPRLCDARLARGHPHST